MPLVGTDKIPMRLRGYMVSGYCELLHLFIQGLWAPDVVLAGAHSDVRVEGSRPEPIVLD